MTSAAIAARIEAETFEYRLNKSSSYLWKPHADALALLVRAAQEIAVEAQSVASTAEKRGLADKVDCISQSLARLGQRARAATELLSHLE